MAAPRSGVCAAWATPPDLPASCNPYEANAGLVADALLSASDSLFLRCGRRWPGVCTATVRPCAHTLVTSSPLGWAIPFGGTGQSGAPYGPFGYIDSWGTCGCNREARTGCSSLPEITLGAEPVISIDKVKVDGVVLDASEYRVDDWRWLLRLPNASEENVGWPCCQRMDLADTEVGTWSVTFKYGGDPPSGGKEAAAMLACEFLKAWTGQECALPSRATSITRQGVTVQLLDPLAVFEKGFTGLPLVDEFVMRHNPKRLMRRSRAWSPDIGRRTRRAGTG